MRRTILLCNLALLGRLLRGHLLGSFVVLAIDLEIFQSVCDCVAFVVSLAVYPNDRISIGFQKVQVALHVNTRQDLDSLRSKWIVSEIDFLEQETVLERVKKVVPYLLLFGGANHKVVMGDAQFSKISDTKLDNFR